jgi:hypothetical protein
VSKDNESSPSRRPRSGPEHQILHTEGLHEGKQGWIAGVTTYGRDLPESYSRARPLLRDSNTVVMRTDLWRLNACINDPQPLNTVDPESTIDNTFRDSRVATS